MIPYMPAEICTYMAFGSIFMLFVSHNLPVYLKPKILAQIWCFFGVLYGLNGWKIA